MSSQARTSTDLWLISGGLVEACVKVDSARWNSCEFLAQRDQESRLKNFSQVFIYFVRTSYGLFIQFLCFFLEGVNIVEQLLGLVYGSLRMLFPFKLRQDLFPPMASTRIFRIFLHYILGCKVVSR